MRKAIQMCTSSEIASRQMKAVQGVDDRQADKKKERKEERK